MDLKEIKALYKFLKNTDIVELEVERESGKVKISRQGAVSSVVAPVMAQAPAQALQQATNNSGSAEKAEEVENENVKTISSPMVGKSVV